jgi:hypothetical protein
MEIVSHPAFLNGKKIRSQSRFAFPSKEMNPLHLAIYEKETRP